MSVVVVRSSNVNWRFVTENKKVETLVFLLIVARSGYVRDMCREQGTQIDVCPCIRRPTKTPVHGILQNLIVCSAFVLIVPP